VRVRGRPLLLWVLVALLGQLAVRALAGGTALVLAPSGRLVGLSREPLAATPFGDFLVPGLVLVVMFGVAPAVVSYGLVARRPWAWRAAVGAGVALLVWLLVEVAVGFVRSTVALNLGTAVGILALAARRAVGDDLRRSP
jgi:hypothetical protein